MYEYVLLLLSEQECMIATLEIKLSHPLQIGMEIVVKTGENKGQMLRIERILFNTVTDEIIVSCGMLLPLSGQDDGTFCLLPFGAMIVSEIQKGELWNTRPDTGEYDHVTGRRVELEADEITDIQNGDGSK